MHMERQHKEKGFAARCFCIIILPEEYVQRDIVNILG